MGDIKNYVKIHKAVQAFCEWSLPSVETCIRQWHQNQQGTLSPCQQLSTCPVNKKPSAKSKACQSCIDWASAVAGECYPPGRDVQWKNVDATVLHKDVVEVAKGFVFILPNAQSCKIFDDFDVGGILKMMLGFKSYHGGDQACVDKIQKVVDIRNTLSHMNVGQQMHIPDAQTSGYFLNIKDLVTDLEGRHACLKANIIMTILNKIQSSDVTVVQIQQATKPLTDGLRQALVQALQQQTQDLQQCLTKHHSDIDQLIKDGNTAGAQALQKQTGELQNQLVQLSQDFSIVTGQQSRYIEQLIKDGNAAVAEALQKQTGELQNQLVQLSQDFSVMTDQQTQYIELLIKDGITEGAEALQKQTEELQHHLGKLSEDIRLMAEKYDWIDKQIQDVKTSLKVGFEQVLEEQGDLKEMISEIKEEVSRIELKQTQDPKDEDLLDVQAVRKQLMTEYKQTRSQVQLLPGLPEECASMDEIFVDMTLCENDSSVRRRAIQSHDDPRSSNVKSRKLESHNDLLTIDKRGQRMKHILVRGNPGCGKSTLISKIAYDWAKNEDPESVYAQFQLVFAIDFKEVLPEMDLFDAIADQLLPKVSKEDLERYIERNSESVLFLFDGYDETYSSFPGRCRDLKNVLSSTLFSESFVLMTTRPHKVATISSKYKINYTHVEVFGLPVMSIFKYVSNFFHVPLENIAPFLLGPIKNFYLLSKLMEIKPPASHRNDAADLKAEHVASFLVQIVETDHLLQICHYPMILTMVCFLWKEDQDLSLILTVLYRKAVVHVAKNRCKENSDGDIDVKSIRKDVDQLLLKVGKIALDGLLQDKLIFTAAEFDDDTLNAACNVGLVSKERKRSKLDPVVRVQFIHKTFQEMSAAYYWASLAESDESLFRSYQKQVDDMEDNEMMLRFCCGESVTAAESIIQCAVEKSCLSMSKTTEKCFLGHPLKKYDPWRLPLLLLFEVDHNIGENEVEHLHSLLRPLVSNLSIVALTNESNGEVWAVLKSFSSKVQSDTSTWFASVTKVIITSGIGEDDTHSQFCEDDPVVSSLVSHMSNLKELIICHGVICAALDCSCLLRYMVERPTASKSLEAFDLESYNFQPQVMAKFLTGQKCLTTLQIGDTFDRSLVTDSEQMIVDGVVGALKQKPLKVLVLDNMRINCKKVFDMLLMTGRALPRLPITKLSLQRSCMVDGSIQSFAEAVCFLPDLKILNLRHHFLKEGGIEEEDFKVFGPALRYLQNLTELDLGGHTIGNSVKEFSQGLQHLTKLQVLSLYKTSLVRELTEFLPFECLTELRTLNLGGNKIGQGIANMSKKLKFLTNLNEFEFGSAELTDDDVAQLPLSSFKQLISLDLGHNALWSEGLCTIADQLQHMPKLQKLHVKEQQSSVSDEVTRGVRHAKGVVALLESLASMTYIQQASLPDMCASESDFASVSEHAQCELCQIEKISHNGQVMWKISNIWYVPDMSIFPWL